MILASQSSSMPSTVAPRRAALLLLLVAILSSGCASRRNSHQYEIDAMRSEYFELEDRYYEAVGRLETAERQLGRRLESGAAGESDGADDPESTPRQLPGLDPSNLPEPAGRPAPSELPGPADSRRAIGSGMRSAARGGNRRPVRVLDRLSARTPAVAAPRSDERRYLDESETAGQRNSRHADEAAVAGVPYYPAPNDERDLLATESSAVDTRGSSTQDDATFDASDDELGWQEPMVGDVQAIDDWEVASVTIDGRRTRGFDSDGDGQDDGLMLVLLPKNAASQTLPVFAPMMIAVLDPQARGEAQRVGTWEFTAEEIAYRQPPTAFPGNGIMLKLPWAQGQPRHAALAVFVRYELPNGARLETRSKVAVSIGGVSGDRSAWSPRQTPLRSASTTTEGPPRRTATTPSPNPSGSTPVRQISAPTSRTDSRQPGSFPGTQPSDAALPPRTSRPAWSPFR